MISIEINASGFHRHTRGHNERLLDPFSLVGRSSNLIFLHCVLDFSEIERSVNEYMIQITYSFLDRLVVFCSVVKLSTGLLHKCKENYVQLFILRFS